MLKGFGEKHTRRNPSDNVAGRAFAMAMHLGVSEIFASSSNLSGFHPNAKWMYKT